MTTKYQYTKLADASEVDQEQYNLYAVIVDATLPYKTNTHNKFICSLKVMDPTLYLSADDADSKSCASVIIYAKWNEDLPVVTRIGDIIWIHWANMKMYKG